MGKYIILAENRDVDGMNILFDREDCVFRYDPDKSEMSLESVLYDLYNREYTFWHIEELVKAIQSLDNKDI